MKRQKREGAERVFGYAFCAGLLAAVLTPFVKNYLESWEVPFAILVVICGAGYAMATEG
jgi:hypothetical protein